MSYRQLNEEIIIDIQQRNQNENEKKDIIDNIDIFIRNTKCENTKISLNLTNTKLIKELKKEVNIK